MQCHHTVGLQAEPTQPCGERRDRPISLREAEGAGCAVGKTVAVWRIGKRERIGVAHPRAPKEVIKRRRNICRRNAFAQDHGTSLKASDPSATMSPANSRKARFARDARFASSALPIAPVESKAARHKSRTAGRDRVRG